MSDEIPMTWASKDTFPPLIELQATILISTLHFSMSNHRKCCRSHTHWSWRRSQRSAISNSASNGRLPISCSLRWCLCKNHSLHSIIPLLIRCSILGWFCPSCFLFFYPRSCRILRRRRRWRTWSCPSLAVTCQTWAKWSQNSSAAERQPQNHRPAREVAARPRKKRNWA